MADQKYYRVIAMGGNPARVPAAEVEGWATVQLIEWSSYGGNSFILQIVKTYTPVTNVLNNFLVTEPLGLGDSRLIFSSHGELWNYGEVLDYSPPGVPNFDIVVFPLTNKGADVGIRISGSVT